MEAIAKTKYLKGSPRKTRLVIDMIRGVNVSRALSILKFTDKRAAGPIAQCLNSAIANATYKAEQDNIAIDPDDLWVKTCFVDMGPTKGRKRMRPAPQGRAYQERRHYCHITIQVTSEEKAKTEQEIALEAARQERIAARKAANSKKKAETPKKEKKAAKVEEAPVEAVAEEVAQAPVEIVEEGNSVEAEMADAPVAEVATEVEAASDAEVADAENIEAQTTVTSNEEQPADEAQEETKEDLDKQ